MELSVTMGAAGLPVVFQIVLLVGSSCGAILNVGCLIAIIYSFTNTLHIKLVLSLIVSDVLVDVMTILYLFYSYPLRWQYKLTSLGFDVRLPILNDSENRSIPKMDRLWNHTDAGLDSENITTDFECTSYDLEECFAEIVTQFDMQYLCYGNEACIALIRSNAIQRYSNNQVMHGRVFGPQISPKPFILLRK